MTYLVSLGIIAVNKRGKVLLTNAYARTILAQNDGLFLARDGILKTASLRGRTLSAAIAKADTTAGSGKSGVAEALAIERPSGKRPYHLLVNPVEPATLRRRSESPTAIVFIVDSDISAETPVELLAGLFELTRTEARVAMLLAQGISLERVCKELSIQYTTGRAHLRNIFGKIGVRRQAELVSLIYRTLRPFNIDVTLQDSTHNLSPSSPFGR